MLGKNLANGIIVSVIDEIENEITILLKWIIIKIVIDENLILSYLTTSWFSTVYFSKKKTTTSNCRNYGVRHVILCIVTMSSKK